MKKIFIHFKHEKLFITEKYSDAQNKTNYADSSFDRAFGYVTSVVFHWAPGWKVYLGIIP